MTTPLILFTTDADVALITINRPEVRNALNTPTRAEMERALLEAEKDPAIRGIVITGAGEKAFVSGGDGRLPGEAAAQVHRPVRPFL